MTWAPDGKRWLPDSYPWRDELTWHEVLNTAREIRVRQDRKQRDAPPVCTTCSDEGQLSSRDRDLRWWTIPCPTCRPAAYRNAVDREESHG